ncbi:PHP domain-containing protein [Armatimonadetes bacterium]|nr:PHP domain-containing protein [bacterium]
MRSDLHIHTALSPCADEDMTPNNIVNMAKLNGLDMIGITDHNSALNCRAVFECGEKVGLKVISGLEITSSEEVHLLCYFQDWKSAEAFGTEIFKGLPCIKNKPYIFGEQLVMNIHDEVVEKVENLLLSAVSYSIQEIIEMVELLGGEVVPAHIDRDSYSIISNLGTVPEEYGFKKLEISTACTFESFREKHPEFAKYQIIQSSDAHYLHQIF